MASFLEDFYRWGKSLNTLLVKYVLQWLPWYTWGSVSNLYIGDKILLGLPLRNIMEMRLEVAWYCVETKTILRTCNCFECKSYNKNHATSDLIFVVFFNVGQIENSVL